MSIQHARRRIGIAIIFLCLVAAGFWWLGRIETGSSPEKGKPTPEAALHPRTPAAADAQTENAESAPDAIARNGGNHDSSPSASQPGNSEPQPLMTVANDGNGNRKPSTREQAAQGRTVADILKDADMSDPAVRARVVAEMTRLDESQRDAVTEKARRLGIPLRIEGPDHKVSILYDFRGDEPLYRTTLNANAAISTGANLVAAAPYSLDGTGIKVGIWDGGSVRSTHQELTGRVTLKNSSAAVDNHATHVAGTIGATGIQPAAKGMAPKVMIDSYEWTNDYAEMTAAGAATAGDATRIPLSNHSYGYGAVTADMGRYETEARSVDAVAASLPYYLPFWAAGNEQDDLTAKGGYQSITFDGLAKNIMTIGAVSDAVSGGIRSPAAGVIAYFSSLGPCDDGRIKPDVVANGINLYSSVATSDTSYDGTYSGTSMATPNAMGSAALLVQLYAREFSGLRMRASSLKALLIHTADDIGTPGPDYKYGWGLINVKAASDLILAHKASLATPKMIEGTITNAAKTATHTFTWDGVSPIRATLCWTDPAGTAQSAPDSRTPNLKHNLDAKITAPNGSTIYQPYVMPFVGTWTQASMSSPAITGKNNVDNVEQVDLASPTQTGTYTVTVSLDGTLTTSSQVYSLILTGGTAAPTNPPPTVTLTSPADGSTFLPGVPVTVSANASDVALGGGPGTVSQVEFFSGTTSLGVDSTAPYSMNWTPAAGGAYSLTAKATDSENGVATSAAAAITVMTGNGSPVISSFTPTSGVAGATVVLSGSNFVNVSAVRFNGADAAYTVNSIGQITATVPALATTGTISVVNSYGTGTSVNAFTVLQSPVLISQIYGGGGNTGATYNRDYVELYNRSASTVSLTGWSVQYASSSGTTWTATALSGSIAPGRYRLVGLASGSSGLALPTVDVSGSVNMNATRGKVALMNTTTALTGSSPAGASGLQDFVGYGTANAYEGTAAAPAPSTTTAIFRAGSGATDTNQNSADFTVAAPNPRNSSYVPAAIPVITATGTMAAVDATYGSASPAPTSFLVSGTNMTAGILVTPPAGFEVSQTAGGATGYAPTQTIGGAGTIGETTVYLRLAAGTTAGSYSGNVVCTSTGAATVNLAVAVSEVRLKLLTITANNQSKVYGASLALGPGQTAFVSSGLIGSETIGSVTLTASGGTAANDAPGIYSITPSAATGGTFNPNNYDFNYLDGSLTVTPLTFSEWTSGLADPAPAGDPDGDGISNLMEYFMGLSPAAPNENGVLLGLDSNTLSLTYRRAKGITGVTGQVEWNAGLSPDGWDASGVTETSTDMGGYEERTATVTKAPDETRKFLRLKVSQP